MRHILHEDPEPDSLIKTRQNQKLQQSPEAAWQEFDKTDLRLALFNLQFGRCAYCERTLSCDSRNNSIEHIQPKSRFPNKLFVWSNLVLSCTSPNTCNRHKKNKYPGDEDPKREPTWQFISPTDARCASSFRYSRNGKVEPAEADDCETRDATKTIDLLNLNQLDLQTKRREVLETIEHQMNELKNQEDSSIWISFLIDECRVDSKSPFYSAKRQCLPGIEESRRKPD